MHREGLLLGLLFERKARRFRDLGTGCVRRLGA